jgi:hypothetical protein
LVKRFAFHEDRAKGLVLSLEGLFGLEEESAGVGPIHDAGLPDVDCFLAWIQHGAYTKNQGRKRVEAALSSVRVLKTRGKRLESISTGIALRV